MLCGGRAGNSNVKQRAERELLGTQDTALRHTLADPGTVLGYFGFSVERCSYERVPEPHGGSSSIDLACLLAVPVSAALSRQLSSLEAWVQRRCTWLWLLGLAISTLGLTRHQR